MGVDLTTYRLRIGRFASRVRSGQGRHHQDHGQRDVWEDREKKEKCSNCTNFPLLRLKRTHAKAGFLFALLGVAVVTMCVTKTKVNMENIHDLSSKILLGGDISLNPGPVAYVQTEAEFLEDRGILHSKLDSVANLWEQRFRRLEYRMNQKMRKMEKELKKQRTIAAEIAFQCERDQKETIERERTIRRDMDTLTSNIDAFADEIANKVRFNDDQTDKIEGNLKKNNIKFFGIPEAEKEPYWNCLQSVLQLLRETMPGVPWSEKDLVRVQRLGPTGRGHGGRSRPVLVQLSTFFDKLCILRHGRDALRSRGVRVSSELTSRQVKTLNDLREQGHTAYYRNNRLWFQDDRNDNRHGNKRFHKRRFQGRQRVSDSTRSQTNHSEQRTFRDGYDYPDNTPNIPQLQNAWQVGNSETGTWAYPDDDLSWQYQNYPPPGLQNQAASQENRGGNRLTYTYDERDPNPTATCSGRQRAPSKKPSPSTPDDGRSQWRRIMVQISSHRESSLSGSDSESVNLSSDEQDAASGYMCHVPHDRSSVASQRSLITHIELPYFSTCVTEQSKEHGADRPEPDTCSQSNVPVDATCDGQQIPCADSSRAQQPGHSEPKRCVQSTVLGWLTSHPDAGKKKQNEQPSGSGDSGKGGEEFDGEQNSGAQTSNCEDAVPESPDSYRSVWRGRLRHSETVRPQASASAPSSQA